MLTVNDCIKILKDEGVLAIPTETVYGLAGSISSEKALNKIFEVKKRPFFDPLIVHVSDTNMAMNLVSSWPPIADKLAKAFWPGPFTMVLPKSSEVKDIITSGLDSVAIRIPNHKLTLELIANVGPLAAPSANIFTHTSPTCAEHVEKEFNDEVKVLDGGACQVGIESTVVGIFENNLKIYRPGSISLSEIQKVCGDQVHVEITSSPVAPGQIKHHYMPKKPLAILEALEQLPQNLANKKIAVWELEDEAQIVARNLYAKMRELDESADLLVFIVKSDRYNRPEWMGIKNRLQKAATYNFLE